MTACRVACHSMDFSDSIRCPNVPLPFKSVENGAQFISKFVVFYLYLATVFRNIRNYI